MDNTPSWQSLFDRAQTDASTVEQISETLAEHRKR